MDDIGQFLFLLAFVIIAAIQWIIKRIQERNAPPEQPEEDPLEDTWRELEEHFDEPRPIAKEHPRSPIQEEAPPQRPTEGSPLRDIRNLFESLREPQREPEVPVPVVVEPPRPVVRAPSARPDPRAGLSEAEKAALKRLAEAKKARQQRARFASKTGFQQLLQGAPNLRQALILKEIFDRPRALRSGGGDSILG